MLMINKLLPHGTPLAPVLLKRATSVALDWDTRAKSRFDATDSSGRHLGVFLPRGTVVRGGDVLVAEDGSLVRVEAAPQALLEVRHCSEHGSPFDLLRAAYHLGNRHVQLALQPDRLLLERDHVLAEMLARMHLIVREVEAAFEPEAGAYGEVHRHGHGPGHHDHDHDHDHDHGHGKHEHHERDEHLGHEHAHGHDDHDHGEHRHGPGCKH